MPWEKANITLISLPKNTEKRKARFNMECPSGSKLGAKIAHIPKACYLDSYLLSRMYVALSEMNSLAMVC